MARTTVLLVVDGIRVTSGESYVSSCDGAHFLFGPHATRPSVSLEKAGRAPINETGGKKLLEGTPGSFREK
jgi:hypothetical protein